jgi:hypothetical protein
MLDHPASAALGPVPQFRPYEPGPFRMAMALTAVAEPDWLEFAEDTPTQMAERRRLIETTPDAVLACLPEAEPAAQELLNVLVAHLCTHHPAWFQREGHILHNHLLGEGIDLTSAPPLEIAGRLVQEDFCLMQEHQGAHHLTGAVLCFPTRWSLAEKLGHPLITVHEKVPFYAEKLGNPVERFFRALRLGRLAQRLNWSVIDSPDLFQLKGKDRSGIDPDITPTNALTKLYLRVERQTFRRLPTTNAVIFGIRIHVTPLNRVTQDPNEAQRLTEALKALPPEMAHYKSTGRFIDALLKALKAKQEVLF